MVAPTTCGDEDIRRALEAGVQAYLAKDVLRYELLKAIRVAAQAGAPSVALAAASSGGRANRVLIVRTAAGGWGRCGTESASRQLGGLVGRPQSCVTQR